MTALRVRRSIVEHGPRIELTHTALQDGGKGTLLHEIGHVVFNARLIPQAVRGTEEQYGTSVHKDVSEKPAYAYMHYLMNPSRLLPDDRAALDAAFVAQGLPSSAASTRRGR